MSIPILSLVKVPFLRYVLLCVTYHALLGRVMGLHVSSGVGSALAEITTLFLGFLGLDLVCEVVLFSFVC